MTQTVVSGYSADDIEAFQIWKGLSSDAKAEALKMIARLIGPEADQSCRSFDPAGQS